MPHDQELRRLAARIAGLERQQTQLSRTSQLAHSSIENGAVEVYDDGGSLRAIIGQQPDGTTAATIVNGPPPPRPTQPTVTPVLGGIEVAWHGTFTDAQATPLDFSRVEIHAAPLDNFAPAPGTLRATIESPVGSTLTVATEVPLFVRLVARSTSGTASQPSATSGPAGPAKVVAQAILDGIVDETALAAEAVSRAKLQIGAVDHSRLALGAGNLMPDPGFEGTFTERLITGNARWTLAEGNGSARCLRADASADEPATRSLRVTELPANPGDRFYLAFDSRVTPEWNGEAVRLLLQWTDADGTTLGYGIAAQDDPGQEWTRTWQQVQAPENTATATIWLETYQASAGHADIDNCEIRTVIGAGMVLAASIGANELAAEAVVAGKIAADTITGREVKARSLIGDNIAVNTLTGGHIRAGTLDANHLRIGTTGNLVADASYETGLMAGSLTSNYAEIVDDGNNSAKALRITAAPELYRYVQHWPSYVQAGERYWIGCDYRCSEDFSASIALFLGFYDANNIRIGSQGLHRTDATTSWKRMTEIVDIPEGTVSVRLRVGADGRNRPEATGYVYFDNLECRALLTTPGAGERAELSPQGLRLFDADGDEAVSLVTGAPNYLTLTNNGTAVATIDQHGNGGFQDLSVAGDLIVSGDNLTELLEQAPRGTIACAFPTRTVLATGSDMGYYELPFTAETGRMYRIFFSATANPAGGTGGEIRLDLRDGGASAPTIDSPVIQNAIYPITSTRYYRVTVERIVSGTTLGAGLHRMLLTFWNRGGPSNQTVELLGSSWRPCVFAIEDVGPAIKSTGGYNTGGGTTTDPTPPPPSPPPVQRYTKTYASAWSGSYANRSGYNSYYGNKMMQGYYSSNNGMQASLVGFSSTMASDLNGATIEKAEIYLYFDHWYYNDGGTAVIKTHTHTSRPGSFTSDSASRSVAWKKNEGKWVNITSLFTTTKRGIALDPNNSNKTYYGRARGHGQTNPPKLRITYTK